MDLADPGSFALARYLPDGRLDTSFGSGGRSLLRVGVGFDAISDLLAGWGDRVVALGQAQADGRDHFALARFTERGTPDLSFDSGGSVIVPTSAPYAYAAGGAMLPDGRIVAVGGSGQSSAVENLRLSGAVVGYSGDTVAPWLRPVGATYSYANAAVARPDGRGVLSAGVATERSGHPGMALVRTSAEGALDPGWDGDGIALVRARDGSVATDVVLEPNGRAVAAGHSSLGARHAFMLARFDGAGALDRSFGAQGVVLTDFPGTGIARATALARQADGKLVVAGIACAGGSGPQCGGGTARLALARYLGGDAAAPGSPPGSGDPNAGRHPPRRAVRAAAHPPDRPQREDEGADPLPAGQALPRQAQPAAPAHEAQRAADRLAHDLDPRQARGDLHREAAAQAPRLEPQAAGADRVRGPRRRRREAQGHSQGHPAPGLSGSFRRRA